MLARMNRLLKRPILVFLCAFLLLTLAACAESIATPTETDADVLLTAQASNPLPTAMVAAGARVSASPLCLVQTFTTVSVDADYVTTKQGDMLAWNPASDQLAYVRPVNGRWGWFVGDLVVYDFTLQKDIFTSADLEVMGDMAWSPDGSNLAYVVLDPEEKTYTVYVGGLVTGLSADIFGSSAKTDEYSSTKGILGWVSDRNVEVASSCGVDCMQKYNYNTDTSVLTKEEETRKNEDPSLDLVNQTTSPDGVWSVVVDEKNNVWLANAKTKVAAVISAGTAVEEIKWSPDSRYLSLRFSGEIKVFDVTCKK